MKKRHIRLVKMRSLLYLEKSDGLHTVGWHIMQDELRPPVEFVVKLKVGRGVKPVSCVSVHDG